MSPKYSLTKADLLKVARSFFIVVFSAMLTAAGTSIGDQLQTLPQQVDFGIYSGFAIAICAACTDLVRRWLTDYTKYLK
jgi:hypothetical protein